jgi:hypothetical protein
MPAIELEHSERCAMGAHALFSFQIVPLTCAAVENTRVANNWKQEIEVMTSASCESIYCSAPIALRLHMPIVREMRLNGARQTLHATQSKHQCSECGFKKSDETVCLEI